MNSETSTNDYLQDQPVSTPKLPATLNVLTILTFIGCAWELYSTVSNFMKGKKAIEEIDKAREQMADAPAWAQKMAGPEMREIVVKGYENRIPLFIIGLVAIALCLYGAIEMRKLKKQGYYMWLIGEILPWIAAFIFIGAVFFKTFIALFLIFPVIFIILYTVQKKNLVK